MMLCTKHQDAILGFYEKYHVILLFGMNAGYYRVVDIREMYI